MALAPFRWLIWLHKNDWEVVAGGIVVVLVTAAGLLLEHTRPMQVLDSIAYSAFAVEWPDPPSDKIEIVAIDDATYHDRNLFEGISPLKEAPIHDTVRLLLNAGASVVALDIDTSHWKTHDPDPRLVWGTNAEEADSGAVNLPPDRSGHFNVYPDPGIGVVLDHPPCEPEEHPRIPSLSEKIATVFWHGKECQEEGGGQERLRIGFVERAGCGAKPCSEPGFRVWPMARILQLAPDKLAATFAGKIVLIGGTARDLNDLHPTPFGTEAGLLLHAEMVSSQLSRPRRGTNGVLSAVLEFLLGILGVLSVDWLKSRLRRISHREEFLALVSLISLGIVVVGELVLISLILKWIFLSIGGFIGVFAMLFGIVLREALAGNIEAAIAFAGHHTEPEVP